MTRFVALSAALLVTGVSAGGQAPAPERTLVAHDFTASAQGWRVSGDTGTTDPEFHREGGQAGGYISNVDEAVGETWYFSAPDSVLKMLGAAEGGTLSFSLKQSMDGLGFIDDDVIVQGPAGRLSYRFGRAPGTDWTAFSVRLSANGWRWNWNAAATAEQMRSVLANPTSLEIRGEFHTGPDEAGLDTVVLKSGR